MPRDWILVPWLLLVPLPGLSSQDRVATPGQLERAIERLYAPGVAWRKISWRSCLLEGLRESRRTSKPILLWIFIDRPADDARC